MESLFSWDNGESSLTGGAEIELVYLDGAWQLYSFTVTDASDITRNQALTAEEAIALIGNTITIDGTNYEIHNTQIAQIETADGITTVTGTCERMEL